MKTTKALAGLLALVLALALLPVCALAAEKIDLDRDCQLCISYQDGDKALSGASFSLYRVADLDADGTPTATTEFASFNVNIRGQDDKAWKALAATLEGYVLRDGLQPLQSGKTDSKGQLLFSAVRPGLYLLLGAQHRQDGRLYDAQPAMVLLPGLDASSAWNYSVTVKPKFESQPEPVDETVSRKVIKVWADRGHRYQRPNKVVVQLLRDGKVYDTVTLSAGNNWRYSWDELEKGPRWIVVEKVPYDYNVEVEREGDTFIVTNTWDEPDEPDDPEEPDEPRKPKDPPDEPRLPQTGQLWWPVPLLLSAGLLCIVLGLLRRRGDWDDQR